MPVLDKLNDHIVRVMRSPALAERIKAQYLASLLSTPEEFRKMLAADVGKWNRIVKTSGSKLD